jgi:hypothetical protein
LVIALAVVLGGSGMVGGCGEDSDPPRNGTPAGMGGGNESLCDRVAELTCAAEQACCSTPRPMASCVAAVLGDCIIDAVAADPKVGLDQAGADAALAEFQQRTSTCDSGVAAWAVSQQGFPRSYDGTIAAGGDCTPPNGLGASQTQVAVALASCQDAASTACLPTETTWSCAPRAAAGGPCFTDLNCQAGLYCMSGSGTFDGTCAARKADGQACVQDSECTSILCRGDVCVSDQQSAYCPD